MESPGGDANLSTDVECGACSSSGATNKWAEMQAVRRYQQETYTSLSRTRR